jgi:hypothetical protein
MPAAVSIIHAAGDLLAGFSLSEAGSRRVATCSGGKRRRLEPAPAGVTTRVNSTNV